MWRGNDGSMGYTNPVTTNRKPSEIVSTSRTVALKFLIVEKQHAMRCCRDELCEIQLGRGGRDRRVGGTTASALKDGVGSPAQER